MLAGTNAGPGVRGHVGVGVDSAVQPHSISGVRDGEEGPVRVPNLSHGQRGWMGGSQSFCIKTLCALFRTWLGPTSLGLSGPNRAMQP